MPSVLGQSVSSMEKQRAVAESCTFICAVCGDGFGQYPNVLRHMAIHGPLDSFSFDGSSNSFEVPREYVLQDNGTLTVLNGSTQSDYPKRPSSPGILPSHLSCPINTFPSSPKQLSSPREVLASKSLDSNLDNSHGDLYCCEICSRTFENLLSLHRHQRYRNEGGYRCTLCCKFFKARPDLKKHIHNHTFEHFRCCASCGKRFVKTDALKNHMAQCHSSDKLHSVSENHQDRKLEKTYTCKRCKLVFLWLTDFQTHSYYQCKGKKVSGAFEIETSPKMTKDNVRTCNGATTHARNGPIPSLINASNETDSTYRCGLCGEQFPELAALKEHHITHQKKESSTQKIAKPKSFKALIPKGSRNIRKKIPNVKKLKMYRCKLCRCVFRHSSSLRRHVRYHESSTCEFCGQRIQQHCDLIKHLMLHKREMKSRQDIEQVPSANHSQTSPEGQKGACRNYKCPECGKKFGLLCVYRIHLRYHKKEGKTATEDINSSRLQNPCNGDAKESNEESVLEKCHSKDMEENDALNTSKKNSPEQGYTCPESTQTLTSSETLVQQQVSHEQVVD